MLISVLFAIAAAAPLKPVPPYAPPGSWNTVTSQAVNPQVYEDAGMTPPEIIWKRQRETLHWTFFSAGHKLDNAASVLSLLRSTRWLPNEKVGPFVAKSESRCSGKAWWVRWTFYRATGNLDVRELFFQQHSRQAMISYAFPSGKSDDLLLGSMIKYCSTFNP